MKELTTPGKLDVELMRREVEAGTFDPTQDSALKFLLTEGYQHSAEFQAYLVNNLQSSHMR